MSEDTAEVISIQHIISSEKTKRKSKKSQGYKPVYIFSFPSEGTTYPINHRASLKSTESHRKRAFWVTSKSDDGRVNLRCLWGAILALRHYAIFSLHMPSRGFRHVTRLPPIKCINVGLWVMKYLSIHRK